MKGRDGAELPLDRPSEAVRHIMRKHGLSEPSARTFALLAYGEAALHE